MKRNQSGFTLIEIAIVLVIIGLLLGGVLKGQELINSAKVKNLAGDFKNIPVYIYGFQDKFKALPGDDSSVTTHLNGATACTPTAANKCDTGNGVIDGAWNSTAITDESYVFWQHIRMAGFGPGSINTADAVNDYVQKNAVGGRIGITNSVGNTPITGMKGTYVVCSDGISGKFAKQLDTTLDNGETLNGSVLVSGGTVTAPPAPTQTTDIVDDVNYLVCMGY
jgi:prepilin-type N-terminal cleavage/methylation domain-containing protein